MATTALGKMSTMNFRKLALQAQQLKDNTGAAINISDLTNGQAASLAAGSTKTLTTADNGKTILLNALAGSVVTLPAASGSRTKFRFLVSVLATSASHKVQVANGTDVMIGIISGTRVDSGNAVLGFAAQSTSDTITLNRSTTGSVTLGEWITVEDISSGVWAVAGVLSATGAAFATPFTAAVS